MIRLSYLDQPLDASTIDLFVWLVDVLLLVRLLTFNQSEGKIPIRDCIAFTQNGTQLTSMFRILHRFFFIEFIVFKGEYLFLEAKKHNLPSSRQQF